MGKFYENLNDLSDLVKKIDKKEMLPIFIIRCIQISKNEPELSVHEILKKAKKSL